jgi:hypothetical protein
MRTFWLAVDKVNGGMGGRNGKVGVIRDCYNILKVNFKRGALQSIIHFMLVTLRNYEKKFFCY